MNDFLNNQKTIGIVGKGPDADHFISQANALGYKTYQLWQEDLEISSEADELFIGLLSEEKIQREFVMKTDLLIYFNPSIDLEALEIAEKSLIIPQGEDLLAISQDRSLQKAFYESLGVNLAPYELIVKKDDIVNAMSSIGYPAVLRRNVIQKEASLDSYFIYDEKDIEGASELLQYGPAVLESWIVADHYLAVTAIKESNGDIHLYPIVKKHYKNERLAEIKLFETKNVELVAEIKKVTKLIIDELSFVGLISLNFILSPAEALYLGDLYPYPNHLSRYTEANPQYSSLQFYLRALDSLPLAKINPEEIDFSYQPVYADEIASIRQLLLNNPEAQIYLYPELKNQSFAKDAEIGYLIRENKQKNSDVE
ncbi:MAG: ATP-grasp domain-containing protein [Atopostipes suicloacalis]|nr:ATP-grasp domain-containing protein [Atopostipes suicloacalis]